MIKIKNKSAFLSIVLVVLGLVHLPLLSIAQTDSTLKPQGKVIIQVINRTLLESIGNKPKFGMYINRAHFGYRYQFHPKWSGTVVLDAGRPTVFGNLKVSDSTGITYPNSYSYKEGSYYTMTLKFSYLEFCPTPKIKLQAGGILQNHYLTQEKFWGYRYILETFDDRYFGIPSADLGFIGYFSPLKWFSFDAAVTNGEGFRFNQDTYGKVKYAAGIDLKPIEGLITRFYYDNSSSGDSGKPARQQLISLFTGYRIKDIFRMGVEYNYHVNHGNIPGNDMFGLSLFSSVELNKRTQLFCRFDHLKSNKLTGQLYSWHHLNDGQAYIAGIHFVPVKNIALSLSYQGWNPSDENLKYTNTAAFSFEFLL